MKKRFATALASLTLILPAGVVVATSAGASVPCSVTSKMAYMNTDQAMAWITGYCNTTNVAHMYWTQTGYFWTGYHANNSTWGYSIPRVSVMANSSVYAKANPSP